MSKSNKQQQQLDNSSCTRFTNDKLTERIGEQIPESIRQIPAEISVIPHNKDLADETNFDDVFGESIPYNESQHQLKTEQEIDIQKKILDQPTPEAQSKKLIENKSERYKTQPDCPNVHRNSHIDKLKQSQDSLISSPQNEFKPATYISSQKMQETQKEVIKPAVKAAEKQTGQQTAKLNEKQPEKPVEKQPEKVIDKETIEKQQLQELYQKLIKSENKITQIQDCYSLEIQSNNAQYQQFDDIKKQNSELIAIIEKNVESQETIDSSFYDELKLELINNMCGSQYFKQQNQHLQQVNQSKHKQCVDLNKTVETLKFENNEKQKEIQKLKEEIRMLKTFYATSNNQPATQDVKYQTSQKFGNQEQQSDNKLDAIEQNSKIYYQEFQQNISRLNQDKIYKEIQKDLIGKNLWTMDKEAFADNQLFGIPLPSQKKLRPIHNKEEQQQTTSEISLQQKSAFKQRSIENNIFELAKYNKDQFIKHSRIQLQIQQSQENIQKKVKDRYKDQKFHLKLKGKDTPELNNSTKNIDSKNINTETTENVSNYKQVKFRNSKVIQPQQQQQQQQQQQPQTVQQQQPAKYIYSSLLQQASAQIQLGNKNQFSQIKEIAQSVDLNNKGSSMVSSLQSHIMKNNPLVLNQIHQKQNSQSPGEAVQQVVQKQEQESKKQEAIQQIQPFKKSYAQLYKEQIQQNKMQGVWQTQLQEQQKLQGIGQNIQKKGESSPSQNSKQNANSTLVDSALNCNQQYRQLVLNRKKQTQNPTSKVYQ